MRSCRANTLLLTSMGISACEWLTIVSYSLASQPWARSGLLCESQRPSGCAAVSWAQRGGQSRPSAVHRAQPRGVRREPRSQPLWRSGLGSQTHARFWGRRKKKSPLQNEVFQQLYWLLSLEQFETFWQLSSSAARPSRAGEQRALRCTGTGAPGPQRPLVTRGRGAPRAAAGAL